ncbi:MAG: Flp1 family type IVb pilin [Eubacterium sp.]|nr:Flp1 family type IVb pilin [Eubacterium sp.]
MTEVKSFLAEETAISVTEIVLIIVVLVGLVVLFKNQLTALVKNILGKVTSQANSL